MYISSKFKSQLSFNWHLNLSKVCVTQSRCLMFPNKSDTCSCDIAEKFIKVKINTKNK
jgi:hypothetical protein